MNFQLTRAPATATLHFKVQKIKVNTLLTFLCVRTIKFVN